MKRVIATALVLGGVAVGSGIYGAEPPKGRPVEKEKGKIVLTDNETALKSAVKSLNSRIRTEMSSASAKKEYEQRKLSSQFNDPRFMQRMNINVINQQLRNEDNKVTAGLNAGLTIGETGHLEYIAITGKAGPATVRVDYDAKNKHSTTNFAVDRKGYKGEVILRDGKDPVIKAQLKFIKAVDFSGVIDRKSNYSAGSVSVHVGDLHVNVLEELIQGASRTTTSLNYVPPAPFNALKIKGLSFKHSRFKNLDQYCAQALSRLGPVDAVLSFEKNGKGKIIPMISGTIKISLYKK